MNQKTTPAIESLGKVCRRKDFLPSLKQLAIKEDKIKLTWP